MDLSSILISHACYIFAGVPTYLGPLDGNTDIGSLAGRNLIVTEKDLSKRTLQKAASVGFRTKQSRFFSSASTEEAFDADSSKGTKQQTRQAKWSLQLFGVKVRSYTNFWNAHN